MFSFDLSAIPYVKFLAYPLFYLLLILLLSNLYYSLIVLKND